MHTRDPKQAARAGRGHLRPRLATALGGLLLAAGFLFPGCRPTPPIRILLIGLDGAEWSVIDRLTAQGDLPNLAALRQRGTWAELESMEPMISPILWTTIATGKTPDKHGVTWFLVDNPRTGGRLPVTSNVRRVKAFWNMLSDHRLPVGVVGWWATWPAEPIDGFVVSDFAGFHGFGVSGRSVGTDVGKTQPPELLAAIADSIRGPNDVSYELFSRFVDMPADEYGRLAGQRFDFRIPSHHLRNVLATAETYRDAALYLLEHEKLRTLAVYFEGIDSISHLFMRYAAPRMAGIDDQGYALYHRVVDEYYRYQDEILGRLLAAAGPDATVLIVSDHGFLTGADRPAASPTIDVPNAHRWHRSKGVLLAAGPGIRSGHRLEQASVKDITPTLLRLLDLPVADDMDGVVLTDLLTPEFLAAHPEHRIATWEDSPRPTATEAPPPAAAAVGGDVVERLRALGYIGGPDDSSSEVQGNLGGLELHRGDVLAATEAFHKAARLDPLNPQPHLGLAFVHAQQGNQAEAIRELEYALKLQPKAPEVRTQLGDLYFDQGDLDRAAESYRQALEQAPDLVGALIGVGNVHRMRGEDAEARRQFERALELSPTNFVPCYNLGVLAQARGDLDEAKRWYLRADELSPGQAVVLNNLGGLLEREGKVDEAIAWYRKARDADPDHFESRYNLGTMLLRSGDAHGAADALREALALAPDQPFAHSNLAQAYLLLGWRDKALKELDILMRLAPEDPRPPLLASRVLAAAGDRKQAERLLTRAIALGGEPVRAAAAADPALREAGLAPEAGSANERPPAPD